MVHFLAELANAVVALGPTAVVMSSAADSRYFSRRLDRIRVNTGRNRLQSAAQSVNPLVWGELFTRVSALGSDVIHIVGVHQWNLLVALFCKLLGKPLVYTVHDPEPHPGAPWDIRAPDWLTARIADEVVVLTRHGRTQLLKRGFPDSRISVISHPMYSLFRRWKPRSVKPGRAILCIGRIEPYKGLHVLMQAFAMARRRLPGWKLVIAGSGLLPVGISHHGNEDVTILNRYISDREVAHLLSEAAFVVLPYSSATQSGIIALAQAFARPVIATTVGGLREMIVRGKTGILVPPNNPAALARAIVNLAHDPGRLARMGRSIAVASKSDWSPRAVARAHMRVYEEVVRRQGRR
jgi:glycosyltransferase involved in cell wall biosynthesis